MSQYPNDLYMRLDIVRKNDKGWKLKVNVNINCTPQSWPVILFWWYRIEKCK